MTGEERPVEPLAWASCLVFGARCSGMSRTGSRSQDGPEPEEPGADDKTPPSLAPGAVPGREHYVAALAELYRWTTPAMAAAAIPIFGSAAWCALDDEDPAKVFAAVRAALAWWMEQERALTEAAAAQVQASHAISASLNWAATAREPSFVELSRRRNWPA